MHEETDELAGLEVSALPRESGEWEDCVFRRVSQTMF